MPSWEGAPFRIFSERGRAMTIKKRKLETVALAALKQAIAENRPDVAELFLQALEVLASAPEAFRGRSSSRSNDRFRDRSR